MFIKQTVGLMKQLGPTQQQEDITELIPEEIADCLGFLSNVGPGYLTLDRLAGSLSGGEAQRIRPATQIGPRLSSVLYVLDESSISLYRRNGDRLTDILKSMRDLGSSLIVVEHDEGTMHASDCVIDIGPGAGIHGGNAVTADTSKEVMTSKNSLTSQYLSGKRKIEVPTKQRKGNSKKLEIVGAGENSLKNVSVRIPLGTLAIVTGISGSGKSSLVNEVLSKGVMHALGKARVHPSKHKKIKGIEDIDKLIDISRDSIGKTLRGNPAAYTGVFDDICNLCTQTPEAKMRGYEKGRFSSNVKGGRCEACQGDGILHISMHFLPGIYVPYEECDGKCYNEETLQVTYKGRNIYDVLEVGVEEAIDFFPNMHKIKRKPQTPKGVGLGYIKPGQSVTPLSDDEAQHVKLASELQRKVTGKAPSILDELTTGLHTHDVKGLLEVLQRIAENGDAVIVIKHSLDVTKSAGYITDIGPKGGNEGGVVITSGTPEQIIKVENSYTGQYPKKILKEG